MKLLFWRIARFFVRLYVCKFIRDTRNLCETNSNNRSNMMMARIKLRVAKIDYWHSAFESWGMWNFIKPYNFVYYDGSHEAHEQELTDIGFNRFKEFWIDWNLNCTEGVISEKVVAAVKDLYQN